jgi:iron-sulfur cluster assembly protein
LALDERKENDQVFDKDGISFLVDNSLMENCGDIKVDFIDDGFRSGFSIQSTKPIAGAGGGACGSCGSSCG